MGFQPILQVGGCVKKRNVSNRNHKGKLQKLVLFFLGASTVCIPLLKADCDPFQWEL